VLKLDNCNNTKRSLSRSAGASVPSISTAAFNNPAAISLTRGLGVETIMHQGIGQVGLVTGTGRVGAAFSNSPTSGTFFGNQAIESTNSLRLRTLSGKKFEEDKLSLAAGVNLFGGKSKKGLQADIGAVYRKQNELKEDYHGVGLTLGFNKFISIGASQYTNVYYENLRGEKGELVDQFGNIYDVLYSDDPSNETRVNYRVTNFTYSLKFSKFAIDHIVFKTIYEDDEELPDYVKIYNISYFYKKWIITYGRRFEESDREIYDDELEEFVVERDKSAGFLGFQSALGNNFIVGVYVNYYLMNDLSFGLTYFL